MIETGSYCLGKWEEGCGGGAEGTEAMLGIYEGKGGGEVGQEQTLQHLHRRAKEGDGSVGGT